MRVHKFDICWLSPIRKYLFKKKICARFIIFFSDAWYSVRAVGFTQKHVYLAPSPSHSISCRAKKSILTMKIQTR